MKPRLSSLLARAGMLSVPQLQEALIRQAIVGGGLDTALIERNWVPEGVLLNLISRATGFPPVTDELLQEVDAAAARLLPAARAEQLGVCPISQSAEGLLLLAGATTDPVALQELAQELDLPLIIFAATELRLLAARGAVYEAAPLALRYAELLVAQGEACPAAISPQTVTIDGWEALPALPSEPFVVKPFTVAAARPEEAVSAQQRRRRPARHDPTEETVSVGAAQAPTSVTAAYPAELGEFHRMPEVRAAATPLNDEEAIVLMRQASNRDAIVVTLVRALRHYVPHAQAYAVQHDFAEGWVELNQGWLDTIKIRQRRLSLRLPSVVTQSALTGEIYIGPAPDDYGSSTLLTAAELPRGDQMVIVPVRVLHKMVCVLIGHSRLPISPDAKEPLTRLAVEAGRVLAELIAKRKRTTDVTHALSGVVVPPPVAPVVVQEKPRRPTLPQPYTGAIRKPRS